MQGKDFQQKVVASHYKTHPPRTIENGEYKHNLSVCTDMNKTMEFRYYHNLYEQALSSIKTQKLPTHTTSAELHSCQCNDQNLSRCSDLTMKNKTYPMSTRQFDNLPSIGTLIEHPHSRQQRQQYFDVNNQQLIPLQQSVFPGTGYYASHREKWRRPRTVYTEKQLEDLEKAYKKNKYLRGKERKELCRTLKLEDRHVKVWYQNRRAKERSQIRHNKWLQRTNKIKKN